MDLEGFKRILVSIGEQATPANIRNEYLKQGEVGQAVMEYKGYQTIRQKAFERCCMRRMEKFYDAQIDAGAFDEIMPIFKEIRKFEEAKDDVKKSKFYHITLCPADLYMNPFELMKIADDFCKLSFIKDYFYVVEQRFDGEPKDKYNKLGDGIHIHILVDKGDYRFSHTQRDLTRVCRGKVMNNKIQMIRESDLPKVKNYLLGDKKDESKQVKQNYDKLFREQEGLRDHYGNVWC